MIAFTVNSCTDDSFTEPAGKPALVSVEPGASFAGDTVMISGNFLGIAPKEGAVHIDSSITIPAGQCIKWSTSNIVFVLPDSASTGKIFVTIGNDTTNKLDIEISPIPPFATAEVPAGAFLMGSSSGFNDESPVHRVNISGSLIFTKFEISQRLFKAVMKNNPSIIKSPDLPCDNVAWLDAAKFCNELSAIQGLEQCYTIEGANVGWLPGKNGWRLPTEAEWEYACHGGKTGDYSGNGVLADMGWYNSNSGMKSHPSGLKLSNDYGLYDMQGNLWEWCWDWYDAGYYAKSPQNDPAGPQFGERRVVRGGSWLDGNTYARCSNRTAGSDFQSRTGFRIVRTKV